MIRSASGRGLLGFGIMWRCDRLPTFRRTVLAPSSLLPEDYTASIFTSFHPKNHTAFIFTSPLVPYCLHLHFTLSTVLPPYSLLPEDHASFISTSLHFTLKVEAARSSEILVSYGIATQNHNPEHHDHKFSSRENLKSNILPVFYQWLMPPPSLTAYSKCWQLKRSSICDSDSVMFF
jgi:hypothetical protein